MKKKKKPSFVLTLFLILIIAISLPFALDYIGTGSDEKVSFSIKSGESTARIAEDLKKSGVIEYPLFFRIMSKISGFDGKYMVGDFSLKNSMSYGEIFKKLSSLPDSVGAVTVTIPEGYEFRQIADILEKNGLIDREKFYSLAQNHDFGFSFLENIPNRETRLEGYLFPDTYIFDSQSTEESILNTMLSRFDEIVADDLRLRANELNMTLDEVITLASVIEREAQGDHDRDNVSSVFHNRLKSKDYPYLESCATVQYILKERKTVLSVADTKIDSPYNTYKNPGLPIGPISSPGEKAILSALYPAETNYLFFVLDSSGVHRFAETFDEHLSNSNK